MALTREDVQIIRQVVREEVSEQIKTTVPTIVREEVSVQLESALKPIKKDIKHIVNFFDNEILELDKRTTRIEKHLGFHKTD